MSVRSTPASALRQPYFTATPWSERSAAGAAATPAERRLTAQVARAESTLRDVHDELEERTRLLARAKKSIESLQLDLQRARDSEASSRELARERQDADTRRVAELERRLAETEGDETHRDVSRRALVDRLASLERALEDGEQRRVRLEGELALREATAETHREDAAAAARTIEQQRLAIEEARETLEAKERAARGVAAERAERAEAVRRLVASATELRETERALREENATLKDALRRAAEKHEEAMAASLRGANDATGVANEALSKLRVVRRASRRVSITSTRSCVHIENRPQSIAASFVPGYRVSGASNTASAETAPCFAAMAATTA